MLQARKRLAVWSLQCTSTSTRTVPTICIKTLKAYYTSHKPPPPPPPPINEVHQNPKPSQPSQPQQPQTSQTLQSPQSSQPPQSQEYVRPTGNWKDFKRLMSLAKPEVVPLSIGMGCLLASSAVSMSVPYYMGRIIDVVVDPSASQILGLPLPQFFALLSGVFALGAVASFGRVILFRLSGERIVQRLRNNLFQSILKQDISFFDAERSGDLISRLSSDTSVMGKSLTQNLSDGIRSLVMAVGGVSMMLFMSAKLTLTMMAIVPPMAAGAVVYGGFLRKLAKQTQTALADITKVAEEKLGNIRTVQSFAKEQQESAAFASRSQDLFLLARKEAYASGYFFGSLGFSGNITVLALLWYGGSIVTQGDLTVGDLASFMLFTAFVGSSLAGLSNFYTEAMKGIGASSRVFEILEREPKILTNVGKTLASTREEISFSGIDFTYPSRPQTPIFRDVSFTVKPGTVVAICGSSGSGKSTIGSLLLRFYDPQSGVIKIGATPISELNLDWWRKQIGLVSQEPVLFAGTIAENIAYGNGSATRQEIEAAAVTANCAGFIDSFEKKYDTFVGERGISMSGGQKQRIAIARALLKDPALLILDEATSALDAQSEYLVQEALDRLMKGRTVFTIAHRISTIKSADCVVCLEGGTVAEVGPYAELLKKENGVFKKLVENQLIT